MRGGEEREGPAVRVLVFQGFSFLAPDPRGLGNLNQERSHSQDSWQGDKGTVRGTKVSLSATRGLWGGLMEEP